MMDKKKHRKKFDNISSPEEMVLDMQKILTRPSRTKENTYLYRYTKINYLIEMIRNKYMRLNSCESMNDDFEKYVLRRYDMKNRFFCSCFTRTEESLAMYKMYGQDDTIMFKISFSNLERIITYNSDIVIDNKYAPFHNYNIIHNGSVTNELVQGKLYCTSIGYVNPSTQQIKSGGRVNDLINHPFSQKSLAGKIKYQCWEYENEVRLCGELPVALKDGDCIAIGLPDEFNAMITVTLCPGFNRDENKDMLMELEMLGINYSQSVYESTYSSFVSSN